MIALEAPVSACVKGLEALHALHFIERRTKMILTDPMILTTIKNTSTATEARFYFEGQIKCLLTTAFGHPGWLKSSHLFPAIFFSSQ